MDYGLLASPVIHASWPDFVAWKGDRRLALLTTRGDTALWDTGFRPDDILLLGQESAGAPPPVHDAADFRVRIALAPAARSLNMAIAGAVALAEARRQLGY